jgi:hypothetical protein
MLEEEEQQKELELGRGNRARKEVAYQEQLSERDWLKVGLNRCKMEMDVKWKRQCCGAMTFWYGSGFGMSPDPATYVRN